MKSKILKFIFGLILTILLVSFVKNISVIYPSITGKILVLCSSCLDYLSPFFQKTILFLSLIAMFSFIISIHKTIRFSRRINVISTRFSVLEKIKTKYSLQNKIIVFNYTSPVAFCMGIIKPKIYLSSQLLKIMSPVEIETIVLHEKQHLKRDDNFVLLLLQIIKNTFFFFPIIGDFVNFFNVRKEIKADCGVVKELGQKDTLISALRKVIDSPSIKSVSVNTFSQVYDIEPRIQSLLGKKTVNHSFPFINVIISLSVLLIFANFFVGKIEVHAQTQQETAVCFDKGNCQNMCQ